MRAKLYVILQYSRRLVCKPGGYRQAALWQLIGILVCSAARLNVTNYCILVLSISMGNFVSRNIARPTVTYVPYSRMQWK